MFCVYTLFHILFHYGLAQNIAYSSLCYKWVLSVYPFYVYSWQGVDLHKNQFLTALLSPASLISNIHTVTS